MKFNFKSFLTRLFPRLSKFKYFQTTSAGDTVQNVSKAPTIDVVPAPATPIAKDPIDRSTGLGTITEALMGGKPVSNGPVLVSSQPGPIEPESNVLLPGTNHRFSPGTSRYILPQRQGQTVLLGTGDGYGEVHIKVDYSDGSNFRNAVAEGGLIQLTWVAERSDDLSVEIVADKTGSVERQGDA